ncbi:MAG: hypothetical protein GXO86_02035 [Chlorobi bacterium]|nr:hypothetical protein [Chlorobiota bacterium]
MNSSKKSYKELAIPYFREIFNIIDDVMVSNHIPCYLIGANAIALEFLRNGIQPGRGTKDIDFAVMISSMNEYNHIIKDLVTNGFTKVKAPWTFYHNRFGIAVDILPYGHIEQDEKFSFSGKNFDLHVLGFKEVLGSSTKISIEERIARIPLLPGMVLLKLIAWNDRPEVRGTDLKDILDIIINYFEIDFDAIVEHHYDLLEVDDIDTIRIAARVLGREVKSYLSESSKLSKRITTILTENLTGKTDSVISKIWSTQKGWNVQYAYTILSEFKKGITQ